MPREEHRSPVMAPVLPADRRGPHWRALLEARWEARLRELTELSLAYHGTAVPDGSGHEADHRQAQTLLRRAVAARRRLANVEDALVRLAAGGFGRCEQCGSVMTDELLVVIPEARYCRRCDPGVNETQAAALR
jgi:DnaK suppressor protein